MRARRRPHLKLLMISMLASLVLLTTGCEPDVTPTTQNVPDPPTMLSPPDGATVEGDAIVFSWSAVAGATCYNLELNLDSNWSEDGLVYSNDVCDSTTVELTGFENDGTTYYWHVWAFNEHGYSSGGYPFTLINGSTNPNGWTEPPGTVEPPAGSPTGNWTEMSLPQSGTIKGIWGSNGSDLFAVGDYGTLLHSDGNSWRSMAWSPGGDWGREHYHFEDVWGTSGANVFAVGTGPCVAEGSLYSTARIILHYNGFTWSRLRLPDGGNEPGSYGSPDGCARSPYNQLHAIWGRGPNEIYAMGSPDYFLRFDGVQWGLIDYGRFNLTNSPEGDDSAQMPEIRDITGFPNGNIYAVGNVFFAGGQHKGMVWSGNSWRPFATPAELEVVRGIWGTSAHDLYAVGYPTGSYETLLHFDGWNWSVVAEFDYCSGWDLYDLIGTGPTNLYMVGGGCVLHYNGSQVTAMEGPGDEGSFPATLYDIWRAPNGTLFAVGDRAFKSN